MIPEESERVSGHAATPLLAQHGFHLGDGRRILSF
jgi:hypothetical protein